MKITQKTESPLLNRTRIYATIDHNSKSTPKRSEIKKSIANELKVKEDLVSIRHIFSKFGQPKSKIIAHVYKSEKDLKLLETPKKKDAKKVEDDKEEKTKEQSTE